MNLSKLHSQVLPLLKPINRLLIDNFSKPIKVLYKSSRQASISVVTKLDRQIENILKKELVKILPESGFIGEETNYVLKDYNWIVDPIDGTQNYIHHIPNFAVSIALWHKNKPVYALASFPLQAEIIHALESGGIFLNNQKIKPNFKSARKPLIIYSIVGDIKLQNQIHSAINQVALNPRNYGSCVFHGTYLALGRINAGVLINQAIWDIAAIVLLIQEAGLDCQFLSPKPKLKNQNLKDDHHSIIIGPQTLITKLKSGILTAFKKLPSKDKIAFNHLETIKLYRANLDK